MMQRAQPFRVRTSVLLPVLSSTLALSGALLVGCAGGGPAVADSDRSPCVGWRSPSRAPIVCYDGVSLGAGDPIGARIEEVRMARAALEPAPARPESPAVQAAATQSAE